MSDRKYNNILVLAVLGFYVAFYRFFLSYSKENIASMMNISAIIVLTFIAILLYGFRRDNLNRLKKKILLMTVSEVITFLVISYALGIVTGYGRNTIELSINSILGTIVAPIIYIIAIEIFRYCILNANKDKKIVIYITTILITILEITMGLQNVLMYNFETIFKATSAIVIPIIIKNIAVSYVTMNGGLKPVLLYRLIMDMYLIVAPIKPELGEYLTSVIGILLPTFIYMYATRYVDDDIEVLEAEEDEEKKVSKLDKLSRLLDIPATIFIVILVMLISGKFTYAIIGVGSGSMTPQICKGDGVIYKQVKSEDDIKVGDVIVFKSGTKMIIHRLVDTRVEGSTTYYITKGDANNGNDNINLTIDNIKGRVVFKIKYIAIPNLWLKDIVEKE